MSVAECLDERWELGQHLTVGTGQSLSQHVLNFTLVSKKPWELDGRKYAEAWFSCVVEQKAFVGFYFMPTYTHTEIKRVFSPALLKLLKGKSCFHVKKLDKDLQADIAKALKAGFDLYKQKGMI